MSFESNVVAVSSMDRFTKLGKIKNKATIYDIVNANDELTGTKFIGKDDLRTLEQTTAFDNGLAGNKANFSAYVGPLSSYGCIGNNIIPRKIAFKRRNEPNYNGDVLKNVISYARILSLNEDNHWEIVYQSINSITTSSYAANSYTDYWVLEKVSDITINYNDIVAVTFVSSLSSPADECISFGSRTTPPVKNIQSFHHTRTSGGKQYLNPPSNSPTAYSPIFDIFYSSDTFKKLHGPEVYELSASLDISTSDVLTSIDHPIIGDYAIVDRYITSDIVEKTAYTYANEGNAVVWKALDGNYDAENVYFGSNLIATENVGTITIPSSGSTTVNVSGLNLKQALMKILAKEKYPTVTQPSVSLRFTNDKTVVEYGTVVSPTLAISFNPGKYTYQTSTGVSFVNANLSSTNTTRTITSVGTYTLPQYCITTNKTYGGSTYTASITANHSGGITPKTNIGNDANVDIVDAEGTKVSAIQSGYKIATSNNFTGYAAGRIYGYVTTLDNNVFSNASDSVATNTSIITREGSTVHKSTNGTTTGKFTFTIKKNTKRIYIGAYGEGDARKLTRVYNKTVNADMTFTEVGQNIPIYGASNKFTGKYRMWMFTHDNKFLNDAELEVTIG